MKNILKTTAIMLILAGSLVSCGKEKDKEPTEIPFTEYSLVDTNCQWIDPCSDFDCSDLVILINSRNEIEKYTVCTEGTFPEIDFTKHTLLFISGVARQNVVSINISFKSATALTYELNVTVSMGMFMSVESWRYPVLVSKIPDHSKINLKVDYLLPNFIY
ncbi:MAG: hypothetical protein LBG17_07360 [Bacteroidales bacterium]|jgi:predicted small lipoprotein YifL|nr:hypothetical protein [Bacteroidales bacterium]